MTNTVKVLFDNGTWRELDAELAAEVAGLDADGDLLVPFCGLFAPLTPCCNASGKGSAASPPSFTACRSCYRPVGAKYGMTMPLDCEVSVRV